MTKELLFFITLNKTTEEFTLQESNLISLKIPKQWQKPDTNINNPALWVCHLPTNSLGIIYISLYPTELIIKKKNRENFNYEGETQPDHSLLIYRGTLEPSGENEQEKFYRCKLKKQLEKLQEDNSGLGALFVIIILVVIFVVFLNVMRRN